MATLNSPDANIYDAEPVNWRLVVYPIVIGLVLVVGGLVVYYYMQSERDAHEAAARQAFVQAKTPEALVQVANRFPDTTHAVLALIAAADLSFGKKDYADAASDYQRVIDKTGIDPVLRDSARLGLGSALEASGKTDEAIDAYLTVGHRGTSSPYAPYAYSTAARLYEQKNDAEGERKALSAAADLGGDSVFVKEAQSKLRSITLTEPPISGSPGVTNAAPAPVTPANGGAVPAAKLPAKS